MQRNFYFLLAFFCLSNSAQGQGLIVNEFSNGSSGTEEYIELLVVGDACDDVDIREWIVDDNNGDFSGGPGGGRGIASGHVRFRNIPRWQSLATGTLIVLYNPADVNASVPPDDPEDSNNDDVYVLPINDSGLEGDITTPNTSADGYTPAVYTVASTWGMLGLRNGGDAAQVRRPDGSYFHGLSYGGGSIDGGPDNLQVSTSGGGGQNFFFNDADFRDVASFSQGTVPSNETPGAANNTANQNFIDGLRNCAPLPVRYFSPLSARIEGEIVRLDWQVKGDPELENFVLQRSRDAQQWQTIQDLELPSLGNTPETYEYFDLNPHPGYNYYRLQELYSGEKIKFSNIAYVDFLADAILVYPNPTQGLLHIPEGSSSVQIFNALGQTMPFRFTNEARRELDISTFPTGIYLISIQTPNRMIHKKIRKE